MGETKTQCWFFMGVLALNERAAESLFDAAELYEFENPDEFPELNVVTGNEAEC